VVAEEVVGILRELLVPLIDGWIDADWKSPTASRWRARLVRLVDPPGVAHRVLGLGEGCIGGGLDVRLEWLEPVVDLWSESEQSPAYQGRYESDEDDQGG
jgi:hypothetical protein